MSSLVPGSLFYSTGLNRKHTPTPTSITSDELDQKYTREPFNGRPWPASSPVAGVYDIRNSSTKLILINNRRKKDSQLRGKNNPRKEEHRYPEPERHSRCSTPVDRERHSHCLDSSSPYYEPETDLDMDWLNRSQRPQNRFAAGSAVNPRRHTSCQVPSNPRAFDLRLHSASNRPNSRTSLPARLGKGPMMAYNELTPGEQRYFASITRVYSNNQMVRLKRRQYIDILNQELAKGLYTKEEYQRYRNYIALGRQRQYINVKSRATSAPPMRARSFNQTDTDKSFSSYSGDDKSSESGRQRQNSIEKRPLSERSENQRSSTPVKRPQSVKSTTSKKSTSSEKSKSSDEKPLKTNTAAPNAANVDTKQETKSEQESDKTDEIKDKRKETQQENDDENKKEVKEESKVTSNEDDNVQILNDLSKKNENNDENVQIRNDLSKKNENDASDSDTNLPSDGQYSAREGHDRPKSRLGHIPEDTEDGQEGVEKVDKNDKEDKTSIDNKSISNISIENTDKKEDATQNIKDEEDNKYHNSKKSRDHDESSSDEEEKDPDKLQY